VEQGEREVLPVTAARVGAAQVDEGDHLLRRRRARSAVTLGAYRDNSGICPLGRGDNRTPSWRLRHRGVRTRDDRAPLPPEVRP
jgi:hypothetical protein